MEEVHNHVFSRIAAAHIESEPFDHCYVRDVFPDEFYAQLTSQLPGDDRYREYPPPYQARLSIDLHEGNAAGLGPFWQRFEAWINSQEFLDGMVEKFRSVIPSTYDYRAAQLKQHAVGDSIRIGCRTLLNRDYAHFALGPHTDAVNKFITAIFYLPVDDRFANFGTSIYRPKESGFSAWKSPHFPHEKFDLVKTFANVPNSVLIFLKTDKSFHGVQPGEYAQGGRNMLMWVPEIGATRPEWRSLKLPIAIFSSTAPPERQSLTA